jgi:hypothetical protein
VVHTSPLVGKDFMSIEQRFDVKCKDLLEIFFCDACHVLTRYHREKSKDEDYLFSNAHPSLRKDYAQ